MSYALCVFCMCLLYLKHSLGRKLQEEDVFEALPKSVRPSPTSVCSVTESAGQKILRIAISD